jgi:hypothetical protein
MAVGNYEFFFVPEGFLLLLLCLTSASFGGLAALTFPVLFRFFKRKLSKKRLPLEARCEALEHQLRLLSDKVQDHQESLTQLFLSRGVKK